MTTKTNLKPLVSIVITSYNRVGMISEAIESALQQDYENLEIIISDNCSTDNTLEVIQKYKSDPRIKIFCNETNIGMIGNFKVSIETYARGKYFVNLCSDDLLSYPGFISDAVKLMDSHNNVSIVFGKAHYLQYETGKLFADKNGLLYQIPFREGKEVFINYSGRESLGWEGAVIDLEKLKSLNIFQKSYTGFDVSSNLTLLLLGNACFIDEYSYIFRIHGANASTEFSAEHSLLNFNLIEFPYQFAINRKLLEKTQLDQWRQNFIRNRAADVAKRLYMNNRKEFKIFMSVLSSRYGISFRDVSRGLISKIFYSLFYFESVGKTVLKIRRMFLKDFQG